MITKEFWIHPTQNPDIIKIIFEEQLVKGSLEFSTPSEAKEVPLAYTLLQFPFIKKIFITSNFVAIEKNDLVNWEDVLEDVEELIKSQLEEEIILNNNKEPYSVYAEMTPNPNVMKFVSNKILSEGIIDIKDLNEATEVPIALALFEFSYIKEIFIYQNYISLTKIDAYDWNDSVLEIREFIQKYLQGSKPISNIKQYQSFEANRKKKEDFSETEKEIQIILDEYVNPAVSNDGGNIELISYDEISKTAKMLLKGACSGCPSSTMTLKNGVETLLIQMLPEKISTVEAING